MKGDVVTAGVGFTIPYKPIRISDIAVSAVTEFVIIIWLLGMSTVKAKPEIKLKLYATKLQVSEPEREYSSGKTIVKLEPDGTN